ncbi:MAG TPA: DUF2723 domain-containing protein [Candidatus Saccharimonadales bacterium]|nr:DUF2723 domain-containing protein [Candidatus Saccharimonadales bacterium]
MSGASTGAAGRAPARPAFEGREWLVAAALGAAAALLYGATAARDLAAGDAGELLLAARCFGIPHPPGYPVWVWLAGLCGRALPGPFAWRVALLSAASAGAGLALLYRLARRCDVGRVAAAVAVLALGVTPAFWSSAAAVEVYALAFAADAAAAWAVCEYARRGGRGRLFAAAALAGLALTCHQSAVVFLPLAALALARRFRAERRPWRPLLLGLGAGLAPFLWLPLRSAQRPLLDWGHDASAARWIANLSRACYGGLAQNPLEGSRVLRELAFFGSFQVAQWGLAAALLAAVGLAVWAWRAPRAAVWAALASVALPAGLCLLLRFETDPVHAYQVGQFLMPVTAVAALCAAQALDALFRTRARAPALALAIAWLAGSALWHAAPADSHGLARRYGQDLLRGLPPGATLFVEGDNETFTLAWLQKGEGVRPDVRVIHRKGYVFEDPYGLAALPRRAWAARQRAVEAHLLAAGRGPFYCVGDMPLPEGYARASRGLVNLIQRAPAAPSAEPVPPLPVSLLQAREADFVTRKIAAAYLEGAAREALRSGSVGRAVLAYRRLAFVAYDFPEARYDLSRVLSLAGESGAALDELRAALQLAPHEEWLRRAGREMGVRTS